jgi:hypothetical protein
MSYAAVEGFWRGLSMQPEPAHDLFAAIYCAMHDAAPRASDAGALTLNMRKALAILRKMGTDGDA